MTPGKFWPETTPLQRHVKSSECNQKTEISVCLYERFSKFDPGSGSVSPFKQMRNENSQELRFSEKVMFFHKVLLDCERKFAGQTKKLISTKWRSEIAAIMNISVSYVYHNFIFTNII